MAVIEAEGLVKQYEGVRALDNVSFRVDEGDVFALVGPNGAGKTTLLRILTDILRPDSGRLTMLGSSAFREILGMIGYLPEERGLYKSLSPLETVSYFAQLKGLSASDARKGAERALEMVGMLGHARRKLEELSKGMAQRVQFAATLAHGPILLILDEPFSGLDPVSARFLQDVIAHQREQGRTVLLSTHNMEHAEKLCNRLLMLHRGQVRLYGGIADIRREFTDGSLYVEFSGDPPNLEGVRVERITATSARNYPMSGVGRREISSRLVEREPAMCWRDTLAMLVSRTSMKVAMETITATSQGLKFPAAERVCSPPLNDCFCF